MQRDIAAAIARQIRAHVSAATVLHWTAIDPAAYNDYLQGRFFWNRRNVPDTLTAISYFERAIRIDPSAAAAWAGLADCYNTHGSQAATARQIIATRQIETGTIQPLPIRRDNARPKTGRRAAASWLNGDLRCKRFLR
ncbi:MAG: hypothetical protein ABSH00_20525 [Bryobacteraceae bacterium]